ncbi:4-hydroxybenzoate octaprenyltransferase [Gayadomonas joobiniege]|uniref:4-hydroxybenzoate octaprenyltransferase n=1 Tax=Gayadomonas joobiniege TaxID=1234606 RepID=UPI000B102482|nr:4-hydroxybenzoate octaprenyltransferase [Gayadomonas joobiniege]
MMNSNKVLAFIQLTRLNRPIGSYLLLWPTLWALWTASDGIPQIKHLIIFTLGVFIMRSAGCVINDFADRKLDGHVKRTKNRPLATGVVTAKEALILFFVLLVFALILVLQLNIETIFLSFIALFLASLYPFMKRYTHLPQLFLGAAFSMAIPMAFTAVQGQVTFVGWLLFACNLVWTVAYDTLYAMVDRDDDLKVGIKSTAVLFGRYDKLIVFILHLITVSGLFFVGIIQGFYPVYFSCLGLALALFCYQQWQVRQRDRDACFNAFLQNHYAGLLVLFGIILHYAQAAAA